jgi:hypothetical protein
MSESPAKEKRRSSALICKEYTVGGLTSRAQMVNPEEIQTLNRELSSQTAADSARLQAEFTTQKPGTLQAILDVILEALSVCIALFASFVFLTERWFLLIHGYQWVEIVTGESRREN